MSTPTAVIDQIIDGSLPIESLEVFGTDEVRLPGLVLPCEGTIDIWHRLRAQVDRLGHWPLLTKKDLNIVLKRNLSRFYSYNASTVVARGQKTDAEAWFKARGQRWYMQASLDETSDEGVSNLGPKSRFSLEPPDYFMWHYKNSPCQLGLLFVPTRESWQVPALIGFGRWNECPDPHEHAAIFAKWHREYGAEIVIVTEDTVELYVKNPPTTLEAGLRLAKEQRIYCSDIGLPLKSLAHHLLDNHVWFFWWD